MVARARAAVKEALISPKGERVSPRASSFALCWLSLLDRHRCLIASFLFTTMNIEAPTYLFLMRLPLSVTILAPSLSLSLSLSLFLVRIRAHSPTRALSPFQLTRSSRGTAPSETARATSCTFYELVSGKISRRR